MTSPILFRSLRSGKDRAGSAHSLIRQRGSSWSHLRPYTDTDDTRDIAWSKIRPDGLSVRDRENYGDFEIITYWGITPYDEFYAQDSHDSKKFAIQKARHTIMQSAGFGQYPYREFSGESGLLDLKKVQPVNALIFISNIENLDLLRSLAFHNDLIYLDLFHPFESNPDDSQLFSGQVVNTSSYIKEYLSIQEKKRYTIRSIGGSYVSLSTEENIADILNTFFKKRYHYEYHSITSYPS